MTYTPIYKYVMKGTINAPPYQKVTWAVYNTPDMTGAHSGYTNLIDIIIDYTVIDNVATEPGAVPIDIVPGGPAGGDLSGTYPNPTVAKIQGSAVSTTPPTNQQTLVWNSTTNQYEPFTPLGGPPSGSAGGDLGGTYPNPSVLQVHGVAFPAINPGIGTVAVITSSNVASWGTIDHISIANNAGIEYTKLNLQNGIVNSDVNTSAAIAGSKITPNFGSQALTAGQVTLGSINSVNTLLGSLAFEARSIASDDTIDFLQKDLIIYADTSAAPIILLLPAPTNGRFIIIKDKKQTFGTNNLTLQRHAGEKIDGVAASLVLNVNNKELIITSDGTDWYTNNSPAIPSGPAGGDLSGTYPNPTVAKVDGVSYPASPSTNTVPVVTGSNTVTYQQIADAQVSATAAIAGTKVSPAFGSQNISTSGNITISSLGTGVVHSNSGGLFSSSLITNADVSATAAIAGTKITPNFGLVNISGGNINLQSGLPNLILGAMSFSRATVSSAYTIDSANPTDMMIMADTSAGAFTITLPTPTDGRLLMIKDAKQTFGTNNLTLARHGTEKIDGVAASLILSTNNQAVILSSDGTDWFTESSAANITWANDLATSTNNSQNVVGLTGSAGTVAVHAANLVWDAATVSPTITQTTVGTSGNAISITAQSSTGANGGDVVVTTGNGGTGANAGAITLQTGTPGAGGNHGHIYIKSNGNGIVVYNKNVQFDNYGTGIIHSDVSGNLTSSAIVNADISSSAAIATSKIAPGTAGQFLFTNTTPAATWQTLGGDASLANTGNLIVNQISGPDPIQITTAQHFQWSNAISNPALTQAATSTANAQPLTIQAQNATGTAHNGGNLILSSGTSGSATVGSVHLQVGAIDNLILTSGQLQWADVGAVAINEAQKSGTGANNGANTTIQAQQGQQQSGVNANNNGGNLILSSGSAGTGGSGGAGANGNLQLQLGGTDKLVLSPSTITSYISNITWDGNTVASPTLNQSQVTGTGGAAGQNLTVKAQQGQNQSGVNNNNNGGNLDLFSGAPGTGGSGTAATSGLVHIGRNTTPIITLGSADTTIDNSANAASGNVVVNTGNAINLQVLGSNVIQVGGATTFIDTTNEIDFRNSGNNIISLGGANVIVNPSTEIDFKIGGTTTLAIISGTVEPCVAEVGWLNSVTSPILDQKALAATNTPTNGQNLTIKPQAGSNAASGNNNGGNGGNLLLSSGIAGVHTGSGTDGSVGNVQVQIAGTTNLTWTTAQAQWADVGAVALNQAQKSGTGANNGTAFTVQAQQGQQQTGVNANNNGGNLVLASGIAGTGGSGAAGTGGNIQLKTNGTTRLTLSDANITVAAFSSAGIVHNDASGNLSSSKIAVGTDITAGTAGQILMNNATPTPTWTSVSGDVSLGNTGTVTVTALQGRAVASTAPTDTYVLTWVAGNNDWEPKPAPSGSFTAGGDLAGTSSSQQVKTNQATTTATKTADYTITTSDYQIFCNFSAAHNLTLPAPANGMVYHIWDISGTAETNNITLVRHGTEKISGVAASRILSTNWGHWMVTTDGTDWFVG